MHEEKYRPFLYLWFGIRALLLSYTGWGEYSCAVTEGSPQRCPLLTVRTELLTKGMEAKSYSASDHLLRKHLQ